MPEVSTQPGPRATIEPDRPVGRARRLVLAVAAILGNATHGAAPVAAGSPTGERGVEPGREARWARRGWVVALLVALVLATGLTSLARGQPDAGRAVVLAAPWPITQVNTDYYRMVVMPDGYPGVRQGRRVVAHPIYGVYLINGYLGALRRTHDERDRQALLVVAHAAVARMQPFKGALVFWYSPATVPLKASGRSYSALTQAYYAAALARAAVATGDQSLRLAAERVFASLLIPTAQGGVSSPGVVGPVLEEDPTTVPSAILNGWLSALVSVRAYADITGSVAAANLVRSSAQEVARRLPRYDLPGLLGTAYSAHASVELRVDVPLGTRLRQAWLRVDGRRLPLRLSGDLHDADVVGLVSCGRRLFGGITAVCRGLRISVPVTAAGVDASSTIELDLVGVDGRPVSASTQRGEYRFVHDEGRRTVGWAAPDDPAGLSADGVTIVPVSLAQLLQAQVPTSFKHYGGHRVNVYHKIHIQRLRSLAALGGAAFLQYADRWDRYMCGWRNAPGYADIPAADLSCTAAATP